MRCYTYIYTACAKVMRKKYIEYADQPILNVVLCKGNEVLLNGNQWSPLVL